MNVRMQGRLAGLAYFGVVATGIFTLAYAPGRYLVDGDPVAKATAISSNLDVFTAANYAALAMNAFFLALPFALSRFLSPFGRVAARLMILFVAASIPLTLLAVMQHFEIASLVSKGDIVATEISTRLFAYDKWMRVTSIFWGLWLAPLGWLVLKSGAIPRIFGILLILGCAGYLIKVFGPIYYPGYGDLPYARWISMPGSIGEIGTCFWLLIMGARPANAN